MTYFFIILLISMFAACYAIYYYAVIQPVRHEQRPGADITLSFKYKLEKINLSHTIGLAKNLNQLDLAERQVYFFKKKYKKVINPVSLEYDINELKRKIGLQEKFILELPTVLN